MVRAKINKGQLEQLSNSCDVDSIREGKESEIIEIFDDGEVYANCRYIGKIARISRGEKTLEEVIAEAGIQPAIAN